MWFPFRAVSLDPPLPLHSTGIRSRPRCPPTSERRTSSWEMRQIPDCDFHCPGMCLRRAYCVHCDWAGCVHRPPALGHLEEPPPLYLLHWCCQDRLFMCNFWLRLESLTTAHFSKQSLPLYKKQALACLDVRPNHPFPAYLGREIKGVCLLPNENCQRSRSRGSGEEHASWRAHVGLMAVHGDTLLPGVTRPGYCGRQAIH
jgi:hypothetical protein